MTLSERMREDGYDGYAYAYPHKTAYRPLSPPVPLEEAWRDEDKDRLFLYVHLPFCEMRCGFCNLFTTVRPGQGLVERTLAALKRQSRAVASAVSPGRVVQAAFGGGTPSFLSEAQLEALFLELARDWPVRWADVPVSVEVSPGTVTAGKLSLLRALGVDRISLGVQSFLEEDLASLKRPQPAGQIEEACSQIRAAGFPVFNLDLIYGNEGQDAARWQASLEKALAWRPEELYLYPLYISRLTRLDRLGRRPGEQRRALYRQAREVLLASGYRQISMRYIQRADVDRPSEFCCQDDGMVGLGPGARSYTRSLHYSSEFAVGQQGVRGIVEAFNARHDFAGADYGVELGPHEQRVRWLLKSLLRAEERVSSDYARRFSTSPRQDFPQLQELVGLGLATDELRLTEEGLAWTDTIGPWLYSETMATRMAECQLV